MFSVPGVAGLVGVPGVAGVVAVILVGPVAGVVVVSLGVDVRVSVVRVPALAGDIADLDGLRRVGGLLAEGAVRGAEEPGATSRAQGAS